MRGRAMAVGAGAGAGPSACIRLTARANPAFPAVDDDTGPWRARRGAETDPPRTEGHRTCRVCLRGRRHARRIQVRSEDRWRWLRDRESIAATVFPFPG